ncbi:hypothetical protein HDV00_002994 [Rhizophlyctis rosea]|nr:hypothetical protein HDV00_002994 [Rhizophlyctis rosea]
MLAATGGAAARGTTKTKVAVQYAGLSRPFFLSRAWTFDQLSAEIRKRLKIQNENITIAYEFGESQNSLDSDEWEYLVEATDESPEDFPKKLFVNVGNLEQAADAVPVAPPAGQLDAVISPSETPTIQADLHDKDNDLVREITLVPNWSCRMNWDTHHFFVSYRVATDADFAQMLGNALLRQEKGKEPVHSFVDKSCLVDGQLWEVGFLQGLMRAHVIVIMCSEGCLNNCTKADIYPDNMLLEWELALDMFDDGKAAIFLVLVGESSKPNGRLTLQAFNGFGMKFPDTYHVHPKSPRKRTIAETIGKLFTLQGAHGWLPTVQDLVPKAHETLARHLRNLPGVLSSTEMDQLRTLLSPIYQDKDRHDLREAHEPGTRRWLVDLALEWAGQDEGRVMWLRGGPGMGKSVCAAIVADELQKELLLGGTFFCKHNDEMRKDPQKLIHTLAFGLACWSPEIGQYILSQGRDVMMKSIQEQFEALVVKPLTTLQTGIRPSKNVVFVVDALDECGTLENRSPILNVIAQEWRKLPPFVKLFVTSRLSPDIVHALQDLQPCINLEANDERNIGDLKLYAENMLKRWDGNPDIGGMVDLLVEKSGKLFIWMKLAHLHISKCDSLSDVRTLMADLPADVDVMYERNMQGAYEHEPQFRDVLACIVGAIEPISVRCIGELMSIDETDVMRICERLETMIDVDQDGVVKEKHKSVAEYLTDSRRAKAQFHIDLPTIDRTLALRCLSIMSTHLHQNILNLPPFTFLTDVPDLAARIAKYVPDELAYACKYWTRHLRRAQVGPGMGLHSGGDMEVTVAVDKILMRKLLEWVECCAAVGRSDVVIGAMVEVGKWLDGALLGNCDADIGRRILPLKTLTTDMIRFMQTFHVPIAAAPLHTYISAINLTPTQTQLHSLYKSQSSPLRISGTATTWSACERTFEGHKATLTSIALSKVGNIVIVTGSADHSAKVYDLETGASLATLVGHQNWVTSVAVSDDGRKVVTGSQDWTCRVWDVESARCEHKFSHHGEGVTSVALCGEMVATGSDDGTVAVVSLRSVSDVMKLEGHGGGVTAVAFAKEGEVVVTGCADGMIRTWNSRIGERLRTVSAGDWITSLDVTADGERVVVATWENTSVLDLSTGQSVSTLTGHSSVSITPDGKIVATGSNQTAKLWDASSGELLTTLRGHTAKVSAVCLTGTGDKLVTGAEDATAKLWNATAREGETEVLGHQDWIKCVQCTEDGRFVATGSRDCMAKVWDTTTQTIVNTFRGHTDQVHCAALNAIGDTLITACHDKTARVWDVATGETKHILSGHKDWVWWVCLTPDGTRAATGSCDGTAKIWDIKSGTLSSSMDIGGQVQCVALSADGSTLVTWSDKPPEGRASKLFDVRKQINMWNAVTGQHIASLPIESDKSAKWLAVSLDGLAVAVSHDLPGVEVWEYDADYGWEVVKKGTYWEVMKTGEFVCSWWAGDGLKFDDGWVMDRNGRKLLWLPSELRPEGDVTWATPGDGYFVSFNPTGSAVFVDGLGCEIKQLEAI